MVMVMTLPGSLLFSPGSVDARLVILILAMGLSAAVGDAPARAMGSRHPGEIAAQAIALFDRRLNRDTRSDATRRIRGTIITILFLAGALAAGVALAALAARSSAGGLIDLAILTVTLDLRGPLARAQKAAATLAQAERPDAIYGAVRDGIARLAADFTDGVVGPVLFYGLVGLPGVLAYCMANRLGRSLGGPVVPYRAFGWAARRLEALFGAVPARLAGLILALAAPFVPQARIGHALSVIARASHKHPSTKRGWPVAAMAGALGLALAAPPDPRRPTPTDPWIGDGRARAIPADLRRAAMLFAVGCLLIALLLAALATAGTR